MAVRLLLFFAPLECLVFKGSFAVIAHEALRVEFVGHSCDDTATAWLPADVAVVDDTVRLVHVAHLLQEGAPEHLRHVLLLKLSVDVSQTPRQAGTAVANLQGVNKTVIKLCFIPKILYIG